MKNPEGLLGITLNNRSLFILFILFWPETYIIVNYLYLHMKFYPSSPLLLWVPQGLCRTDIPIVVVNLCAIIIMER